MAYLFEPDRWYETAVAHGRGLLYKFPHSMTVWQDANGVFHQAQTPAWEDITAAQWHATRPQIVSDAFAALLIASGIGTCTPIGA